jgi:release factor glutamine methyltransferase
VNAPSGALSERVEERLRAAGCVSAELEAAELLTAAEDDDALERSVRRRESGEPLAWITGGTSFCDLRIRVDPGVYVPRLQSEELARRAAALLPERGLAADLCTGSGAIAAWLSSARPSALAVGVDLDPAAVWCARRNGVRVVRSDLGDALASGAFDVVTVVAPYVPTEALSLLPADVRRFEPRLALDGGVDGLDVLRGAVASAARVLRPGGWLVVEVGGSQDQELEPALAASGFDDAETWFDDAGDVRGLAVRLVR